MVQEGLSYLDQTLLDPENKNTYLYNGKEQDQQTKFFEYGFRDYDAQIGRWHVRDALAESTFSVSPYAYANNNPVNNIDVAGLMFVPVEQGPEISSGFGADLGRMLDDSRGSITGMSTDHGGGGGGGSGGGGHYEVGPSVRVLREWVATGRIGSLTEYWNSVEKGESIEEYLEKQAEKKGVSVTLAQALIFLKTGLIINPSVGVDALELQFLNPTDGGGWYMVNGKPQYIEKGQVVPSEAVPMKVGGDNTLKTLDIINSFGGIDKILGTKYPIIDFKFTIGPQAGLSIFRSGLFGNVASATLWGYEPNSGFNWIGKSGETQINQSLSGGFSFMSGELYHSFYGWDGGSRGSKLDFMGCLGYKGINGFSLNVPLNYQSESQLRSPNFQFRGALIIGFEFNFWSN